MNPVTLEQWEDLQRQWKNCTQCAIGAAACRHVFGRGALPCDVLFVGEAPGRSEDAVGEPFVGASGKLLDHWIQAASTLYDFSWFITNAIACRSFDEETNANRRPTEVELSNCRPRLVETIALANPKIILAIGHVAFDELTTLNAVGAFKGIVLDKVYHPSYVLRCGGLKSEACDASFGRLVKVLKENL